MQFLRTIFWVVLLVGLLAFSFFNWRPVEVQIWQNLVLETKIPALVIISFLLGLVPMWLVHRGLKWRLTRRIATLENAARANAVTPKVDNPPEPAPVLGESSTTVLGADSKPAS